VIPLDAADLVLVAARLHGVDPARALDRIDLDALGRALAEPAPRPGDPAAVAAALLCGLRRHRPLPADHDRFALLATTALLAANGWQLDARSPAALARLVRTASRPARSARELRRLLSRTPTATRRTTMTTRLTDRARRVLDLAQEEARLFRDCVTMPHHLLLGLLREQEGPAAGALAALGIDLTMARLAVAEVSGPNQDPPAGVLALAPRTRQVLDRSAGEARRVGSAVVDTEHLLLALVEQADWQSRRVLDQLGAEPDEVRAQVRHVSAAPSAAPDPAEALRRAVDAALDAGDVEQAAALRRLQQEQHDAGRPDAARGLRAEVARLRALLRENGVDPGVPPA
jgi:ClpA/ClpB-like protein